jgi:hypothetical protein
MNKKLLFVAKNHLWLFVFFIITNFAFGQTTLFQFNFEGDSTTPNINNTAGVVAVTGNVPIATPVFANINSCGTLTSAALSRNQWNVNDYYQISVNTTGFENMTFSFCNSASDDKINGFDIRYSIDGGIISDPIISSAFTPPTTGSSRDIALPADASNRSNVRIYIYKTNNSTGNRTLYLDNVTLTGCPISAGTIAGNQAICMANPAQTTSFSSTVAGGVWSSSNTAVATVNPSTGVVTGVSGGTATITYTVSTSGCTPKTATRTVTVNPNLVASLNVAITAGTQSSCLATEVTFTLTPTNGGTEPTYQWTKNGTNIVGATAVTYTGISGTAFVSSDVIACIMTSNASPCLTGSPATSAGITMTVNPVSVGGTVAGSATVCTGTNTTNLTLSGQVGNVIRWESSLDNFATAGTTITITTATLSVSNLTATTSYRAVVQSSPCTANAFSTIAEVRTVVNTTSVASASPQTCTGSLIAPRTHSTTGATGIGTAINLPSGVTASWSSNVITISGTPTSAGVFNYSIPLTGGCGNISATGTISLVNPSTTTTNIAGTFTFCIDNTNTQTTGNASSNQYAVVNVIKGFNYTFSVGDIFTANESLTILNDQNSSVVPAVTSSGQTGTSITWTSTLSGTVRVLLTGVCGATGSGPLTLRLNAVGNTQDSQTTFGLNQWVGHVYNYVPITIAPVTPGGTTSPLTPSTTTVPFVDANYVGYYNLTNETIDENFGGNTFCFPVISDGDVRTNILTQQFAVRYRMRSTKTGFYFLNVSGDDGVRVYLDGALVFDEWKEQSPTNYCNKLIYLKGNSEIIFDYYENAGQNIVKFSLTEFPQSTNTIAGSSFRNVCSGVSPGNLDGSSYTSCAGQKITNFVFQWQSSSDNLLFADINGATTEDYTPPIVNTSSSTIVYYRRVIKEFPINISSNFPATASIKVTTSGGVKMAAPTISGAATQFSNSSGLIYSVATIANATVYNWTVPTGWIITAGAGTSSITVTSGTIGQNGTISVQAVNGCAVNNSDQASLAVTVVCSSLTTGAITHPTCLQQTGSVTLSGLPSGNWTITTNPATVGLTGLTGNIPTTIVGGLLPGTTYTFTVSNGTCSLLSSSSATINKVPTTTFNGLTWSTPPNLTMVGIIDPISSFPVTILSDVELCSCTVNADKNLEIALGITLKLQDKLTVNGTLTFNDEASLVQINDVVNSGPINYVRLIDNAVRVTDYTYWSSPVSPLKLAGTGGISYNPSSHAGSRFFSYAVNATSGSWKAETAPTTMEIGKGYIIRGPNTVPSTPLALLQATFIGTPNNGTITVPETIYANNFYLLGNPYPSGLDADAFLLANNTVLNGTLYFWTHATEISNPGSGFLQYSSNDYAAYNTTGSVATRGNIVNGLPVISNKPNGKIGTGQGFFVSSKGTPSGSSIVFNNNMRVGGGGITGANSQFFRTSKTKSKTTTGIEKNRIWLNLTNSGGAFKQLLVGYITGASDEYDSFYDGTTFNGNAYVDFYSLAASKNLTIQGKALPFSDSDLVPLGYVSKVAGEFSIAIDEVDGVLKSQDVFIDDTMLNIVHDLKMAPYKFNTAIGTFNDRFVLRYTNKKTLNTENFDSVNNSLIVSKDRNELKVKSQTETIQRITVFNLLGKKILDQDGINSTEFRSSNSILTNQPAIVKITLTSGMVISKKVAF